MARRTAAPAALAASAPPAGKAVATRKPRQDIAAIEDQLGEEAKALSTRLGASESKKIQIKREGFVMPDGLTITEPLRLVVVDFMSWNRYYDRPYDEKAISPPACYAFGQVIKEMAPSDNSPAKQSDTCELCQQNQFGSDPTGRAGKACKNTRELVVMLEEDMEALDQDGVQPQLYTMSIAPKSLKSFDGIAAFIARTFNGPPIKAIVEVEIIQESSYGRLNFVRADPNPRYADMLSLRDAARQLLTREPDVSGYEPPQRGGKSRTPTRAPTTKR